MMVGTIAVLDAYYPGGLFTLFATGTAPNVADEAYARTMAFTTLMMFQLFNVYNCRSSWRSAFDGFFENKWLLVAVGVLAVHPHARDLRAVPADGVPYRAADGVGLDRRNGGRAVLLIGMEIVKFVLRVERRPRTRRPPTGRRTKARVPEADALTARQHTNKGRREAAAARILAPWCRRVSDRGGGAAGRVPSAWRVASARPRSSAPPSDSPAASPTCRGIAPASCCIACAGGA